MATVNFQNQSITDVVRLKIVGKTGSSITLPVQPTNPTAHLDGSTLTMCLAARTSVIPIPNPVQATFVIDQTGSDIFVVRVAEVVNGVETLIDGISVHRSTFTNFKLKYPSGLAVAVDLINHTDLYFTLANGSADERTFNIYLMDADSAIPRGTPVMGLVIGNGASFSVSMSAVVPTTTNYTGDDVPVELKYSYPNIVSEGLPIGKLYQYASADGGDAFTYTSPENNTRIRYSPDTFAGDVALVNILDTSTTATLNLNLVAIDPSLWWGMENTTIPDLHKTADIALTANDDWSISYKDLTSGEIVRLNVGADIPEGGYAYKTMCDDLRINHTVKHIDAGAFIGWTDSKSVTFIVRQNTDGTFDGTETIGNMSFGNWPLPTHLSLPDSIKSIDSYAFSGWNSCSYMYVGADLAQIQPGTFGGLEQIDTIDFSPDSKLPTIGDYAFQNFRSLTAINIPATVTSIGQYAFQYCSALTSIVIPSAVTTIGEYAFDDCTGLTSIVMDPTTPTVIHDRAFGGCTAVTSLTLGASIIGDNAFRGWTGFTGNLILPPTLTTIGEYAFASWENASGVTLNEGLTTVGSYAFFEWRAASDPLVIPSTLNELHYTFVEWNHGTDITMHEGMTIIGDDGVNAEFVNWGTLNPGTIDIAFPNSLTRLNAFCNSTPIRNLVIGSNASQLDMSDFYIVTNDKLESVTMTALTPPIVNTRPFGPDGRTWKLHLPATAYDAYAADPTWGQIVSALAEQGRIVQY